MPIGYARKWIDGGSRTRRLIGGDDQRNKKAARDAATRPSTGSMPGRKSLGNKKWPPSTAILARQFESFQSISLSKEES
jgi:hypothetical protein